MNKEMVSAVTGNIKVSVVSLYQAEFSNPERNRFFFSYNIRIENTGPEMVQLISRFWKITDGLGGKRIVEGEGVVGEQPYLDPGKSHYYSSACDFETPVGCMEGYYVFRKLADDSEFKAMIPAFILEVPFILS